MIAASKSRSQWPALVKLALILSLLAVGIPLLEIGWRTVDPERHDEYLRPGLERPIQELLAERSRLIPRMMKKHKIPGVSVALVDREGIIWGAGFGFTDYGRKTPITRDTSFMIGSMSKTFAALAVMCAVRDGSVELDAPITTYLPEFTINSRFETNPQDKITLRHLLNHTSGMTRENPAGNGRQASYASLADHVNSITNTWLRFPVGSYWEYSGAAFDLVSYLLEVRAQKPFADYLEEKVLQPLNLPNTTVDNRKIEGNLSRAIGHGSRHCKKMPLPSDIPWAGAGGVYSSANDLARFIQFFLNWGTVDGKRFLDVESIVAMYTPSPYRNFGLGMQIYKGAVGHGGDGLGFSADMLWSPEHGFGGVILINGRDFDHLHDDHLHWVVNALRSLREMGFVERIKDSPERPAWLEPQDKAPPGYLLPDEKKFTPYQAGWKKYTGRYDYVGRGWELRNYARLVVALGYRPDRVIVEDKDGYLCVNGQPLDEQRPGVFLTAWSVCLDFSGPKPTWDCYEIERHKGIIPGL